MKVKFKEDDCTVPFDKVPEGEVFKFNDKVYIRVCPFDDKMPKCLALETWSGELVNFAPDRKVIWLDAFIAVNGICAHF